MEYINTLIQQRQQLRESIRTAQAELYIDDEPVDSDMEHEGETMTVSTAGFIGDEDTIIEEEEEDVTD